MSCIIFSLTSSRRNVKKIRLFACLFVLKSDSWVYLLLSNHSDSFSFSSITFSSLWSYQDHSVESIHTTGYWLLMFLVSFLCTSTEPVKINAFIRRFLEPHPVGKRQLTWAQSSLMPLGNTRANWGPKWLSNHCKPLTVWSCFQMLAIILIDRL